MNEYVFMVQARGIQIRENMKNIGAQVLEQVVRGAYSLNGTGEEPLTDKVFLQRRVNVLTLG